MSTEPDRSGTISDLAMCGDACLQQEKHGRTGSTDDVTAPPVTRAGVVGCDSGYSSSCSPKDGARSTDDDRVRYMTLRHNYNRRTVQGHCRPKREAARSMCRPLKQWLYSHRDQPYPTKADKLQLASQSQMTVVQVSNWFANARRRLKKTVSCSAGLSWEQRFKLYNRSRPGNQERMSISSDDDDEEDDAEAVEGELRSGELSSDDDESFEAVSAASTKPSSTSSGNFSGEEKDFLAPPGDQSPNVLPGKFKQGILHRYLNDAYNMSFVDPEIAAGLSRYRKLSGSPNSRDSAMTSCRSSPIKEQQVEEGVEETVLCPFGFTQGQDESGEYDLQSRELIAVQILASLAASNRNKLSNSQRNTQRQ